MTNLKNLERLAKMTLKYEFKFPDGRVAWREIEVNRADIVALPLLTLMDENRHNDTGQPVAEAQLSV